MMTRVLDAQITVATSPARLAAVMNLLHAGVLANPVGEGLLNEILGRSERDVLALGNGVYVPVVEEPCQLAVRGADASALLDAVELLHDAAAEALAWLGREGPETPRERDALRPFYRGACAASAALLSDLAALTQLPLWAAVVEVVVEDDGRRVYFEQAVGVGTPVEAIERALRRRMAGAGLEAAVAAVTASLPISRATELSCASASAIGNGRERVASVRAEVVRVDIETLEMLGALGTDDLNDDVTCREVFDSATRGPVARRAACRLLA